MTDERDPRLKDVTTGGDRLHTVKAGPFRVSTATFAPGFSIDSHYHEWGCVSTLLDGRFEQRFPGKIVDCGPGTVLAKPPAERHTDRWFDGWSRHLIIEIDPSRHEELGPTRGVAEEVLHVDGVGAEALAWAAVHEMREADSVSALAVEGIALQLLARVRRRMNRVESACPAWLDTVTDFLNDNFAESMSLTELALIAGVHRDHLSRVFAKVHGMSIGEYVRRRRVAAAAALLAGSTERISTIALSTGFSDQSHLTRVFKRITGVTPALFRRSVRGKP